MAKSLKITKTSPPQFAAGVGKWLNEIDPFRRITPNPTNYKYKVF
jgi:hypothetical protein